MFRSGMEESVLPNKPIQIPDISPEAFGIILEFIYTGEINSHIHAPYQVLYAAQKYQITSVADKCIDIIKDNTNSENLIDVFIFSHQINNQKLMLFSQYKMIDIHKNVFRSDLSLKFPENMVKCIVQEGWGFSREIDLFSYVITWIKHRNKFEEKDSPINLICESHLNILTFQLENYKVNSILRKSIKPFVYFIRFPLISEEDLLSKVIPLKFFTQEEISKISKYKLYQKYPGLFKNVAPVIPFPTSRRTNIILTCTSDYKGVLHYIKTKYGSDKLQKFEKVGIVIKRSSICRGEVNSEEKQFGWTSGSGTNESSYISVDLGNKHKLIPQYYALTHGFKRREDSLRYWVFEGSCDYDKWTILSCHYNDTTLNSGFSTAVFKVVPPSKQCLRDILTKIIECHHKIPGYSTWFDKIPEPRNTYEIVENKIQQILRCNSENPEEFRYFRIRMTGPNSKGSAAKWNSYLTICKIELYGHLHINS